MIILENNYDKIKFINSLKDGDKIKVALHGSEIFSTRQINFIKRAGDRELTVYRIPRSSGNVVVIDPDNQNNIQAISYGYIRKPNYGISDLIRKSIIDVYGKVES